MEAPKYPVKTLEKAIEILKYLYSSPDFRGVGITEISKMTGMNKSVVHRILETLLYNGLIEKDTESSKYRLGWGLYTIAQKVPKQNQLYSISINHLINLGKELEATVNLGILRGTQSIIISKIESNTRDYTLRVDTQIGEPEEAYATSLGKMILSDKDDSEILDLFSKTVFKKITNNTASNISELLDRIQAVRQQGFSIDNEELALGMICIAMPVKDYTGKTIAAVSVSMISSSLDEKRKANVLSELKKCCVRISSSLGYSAYT